MNALKRTFNPQSKLWAFVFALVAGSFITGMTGYATLGTAYPIVLLVAIAINYLMASFFQNMSNTGDHGIYYRLMHLFEGKSRQFFSSFIGMIILMVLLFVTIGEGKTAALALQQISFKSIGLEYFVVLISILALIPTLFGLNKNLHIVFFLFASLIILRAKFILLFLLQSNDLPAWSLANMYNSLQASDFFGSQGIIYIAFRLAFWSLIALEIFNIWHTSGKKSELKIRLLLVTVVLLLLTVIPGIYMAGVFPAELWQLIVFSEEGCFGACPSLALAHNFGGQWGLYLMATSGILSHLLLVSLCFMLISRVLTHLSYRKLFFKRLSKEKKGKEINYYTLFAAMLLTIGLSTVNLSASYWVGLSLYLSFGLILLVQLTCLIGYRYKLFGNQFFSQQSLCVLTALSIVTMGILFYSGFKGEHVQFLNFAFAIFCFSLWVAATSLVYLLKLNKERHDEI